jgi:2-(1,2-epoxy-1,2-dihydrophenyl)acetyl-CoA isomerase
MYQYLIAETGSGICTLTLNRPEVYNAFNDELSFELQDALRKAAKDEQVKVVVITGSGKGFCSGQDLKAAFSQRTRDFGKSVKERYNPIIRSICEMPKAVICRLNGVAAGAGCSLALACDVIIASREASMTEAFVHIGLVVDSGSSYFLPRMVGYRKAFELASKGSKISAEEALRLGLVNQVVAAADLDTAVRAEADYYASAPAKAIGLMKKMLHRGLTSNLTEALDYEAYMQQIAGTHPDHEEGVKSFLEKRKPQFGKKKEGNE